MSEYNPNWIKFDGTPVTGQVPTQVFASGPMTEAQAAAVSHVYGAFCQDKLLSIANTHRQEYRLADGTLIEITSIFGVDSISVVPATSAPTPVVWGIGVEFRGLDGAPLAGFDGMVSSSGEAQKFLLTPRYVTGTDGVIRATGQWGITRVPVLNGGENLWVSADRNRWLSVKLPHGVQLAGEAAGSVPPTFKEVFAGNRVVFRTKDVTSSVPFYREGRTVLHFNPIWFYPHINGPQKATAEPPSRAVIYGGPPEAIEVITNKEPTGGTYRTDVTVPLKRYMMYDLQGPALQPGGDPLYGGTLQWVRSLVLSPAGEQVVQQNSTLVWVPSGRPQHVRGLSIRPDGMAACGLVRYVESPDPMSVVEYAISPDGVLTPSETATVFEGFTTRVLDVTKVRTVPPPQEAEGHGERWHIDTTTTAGDLSSSDVDYPARVYYGRDGALKTERRRRIESKTYNMLQSETVGKLFLSGESVFDEGCSTTESSSESIRATLTLPTGRVLTVREGNSTSSLDGTHTEYLHYYEEQEAENVARFAWAADPSSSGTYPLPSARLSGSYSVDASTASSGLARSVLFYHPGHDIVVYVEERFAASSTLSGSKTYDSPALLVKVVNDGVVTEVAETYDRGIIVTDTTTSSSARDLVVEHAGTVILTHRIAQDSTSSTSSNRVGAKQWTINGAEIRRDSAGTVTFVPRRNEVHLNYYSTPTDAANGGQFSAKLRQVVLEDEAAEFSKEVVVTYAEDPKTLAMVLNVVVYDQATASDPVSVRKASFLWAVDDTGITNLSTQFAQIGVALPTDAVATTLVSI